MRIIRLLVTSTVLLLPLSGLCESPHAGRAESVANQIAQLLVDGIQPQRITASAGTVELEGHADTTLSLATYLKSLESRGYGRATIRELSSVERDGRRAFHYVIALKLID